MEQHLHLQPPRPQRRPVPAPAKSQPSVPAASHPALSRFVAGVDALLESRPLHDVPEAVAGLLAGLARVNGLLAPHQRRPGDDGYRRHLLHRDPRGRYTLMALVWRPGQGTPVHGHSAWCSVAVLTGRPTVERYDYEPGYGALATGAHCCCPGEVAWEQPGVSRPHRIYNADRDVAITLHCYGRDLASDPCAINLPV